MQLPQVWLETSVASISANARKVNQEGVRLASIPLKRGPSKQGYVTSNKDRGTSWRATLSG